MQHILIPTDFSRNAWNATVYALHFFKKEKVTFHFLHIDIFLQVNKNENLYHAGLTIKNEISEAIKADMDEWISKVFTSYPNANHNFRQYIQQGPFVESIRDYIAEKDIQFMVMGTKGASGLQQMTVGSKTGAVITRVKCPILVIPEDATFKKPINIGFPTDFNMLYKQKIINTLLDISKVYQSSIKVLRVAQTQKPLDNFQNNNRDILKQQFSEVPHSFHVIEDPHLENALQAFVNTMNIDIIAMIGKNLNFFQRLLFRPQVAQISYHMKIPFLVLHE